MVRFYTITFSTAVFLQRFRFSTFCLGQWLPGAASYNTPKENFSKFRSPNCWKMYFSWIFFWNVSVSSAVLKKSWLERYMLLFFMRTWKFLNQRVIKEVEWNGKSFKTKKTKTKKKHMKKTASYCCERELMVNR